MTQAHQGYGFVEFMGEEDADYAIKIMNMIKLYGKPIRVNKVGCYLHDYVIKATNMMKCCNPLANPSVHIEGCSQHLPTCQLIHHFVNADCYENHEGKKREGKKHTHTKMCIN